MVKLVSVLDQPLWDDEKGQPISPRFVLDHYSETERDPWGNWDRIQNASLEYPILVTLQPDGTYDVVDGLHRLCKASLAGSRTIRAKIMSAHVMKKARVKVRATLEPPKLARGARDSARPRPAWLDRYSPDQFVVEQRPHRQWFVQPMGGGQVDDRGALYDEDGEIIKRFTWRPEPT
jgi:hypothetical protein